MKSVLDSLFVFVGIALMFIALLHPQIKGLGAFVIFIVGWSMTETFYKSLASRKSVHEYTLELKHKQEKREAKEKKKTPSKGTDLGK